MNEKDILSLMLDEMRSMNGKIDILMADKSFRDGQEEIRRKNQKFYTAAITVFISTFITVFVDFLKRKLSL